MEKQEKKSGYSIPFRPPAVPAAHYRTEASLTGGGSHPLRAMARRTVWISASSTQPLMDASSLWIGRPERLVTVSAMEERSIFVRESRTPGPREFTSQPHLP